MIERKKKICKECDELKFLFSKGRCEYCAKKEYMANAKENRKKRRKSKRQKLSNLKKDARYWFQRWIRYKTIYGDNQEVYCAYGCGKLLKNPKGCDAGHYLKAELYPEAIFDERNVNPVCKGCNIRDPLIEYRKELIQRNGEDWVRNLEDEYKVQRGSYKWDRAFLTEIKEKYRTLCREFEEQLQKSKVDLNDK